jgi:hypothetical protein
LRLGLWLRLAQEGFDVLADDPPAWPAPLHAAQVDLVLLRDPAGDRRRLDASLRAGGGGASAAGLAVAAAGAGVAACTLVGGGAALAAAPFALSPSPRITAIFWPTAIVSPS